MTTTIQVKYVNPPKDGKKRGSIKTTADEFFGVWADKIHLFEAGKTYEIEVTETSSNGVTYRNVKTVKMVETPPAQVASAVAASSSGTYRETCARDAERMFVCSLMNAFIQAGKADLNGPSLVNHTLMLRKVWQHTFGQTAEAAVAVPAKAAAGR
jgi:hypothetical protein